MFVTLVSTQKLSFNHPLCRKGPSDANHMCVTSDSTIPRDRLVNKSSAFRVNPQTDGLKTELIYKCILFICWMLLNFTYNGNLCELLEFCFLFNLKCYSSVIQCYIFLSFLSPRCLSTISLLLHKVWRHPPFLVFFYHSMIAW